MIKSGIGIIYLPGTIKNVKPIFTVHLFYFSGENLSPSFTAALVNINQNSMLVKVMEVAVKTQMMKLKMNLKRKNALLTSGRFWIVCLMTPSCS